MANVKLLAHIQETLRGLGVPEVKILFEPAKAERFELTEEDAKAYAAQMKATFDAFAAQGIAAKDFVVTASDSSQVMWERDRRFTDKHALTLPLMQPAYNNDSRNDFLVGQLIERLRVATFVGERIAEAVKNPKFGSFSLYFAFDKFSDPRRSWAEVKSWEPVMRYWFGRMDAMQANRVDFTSSWNTGFSFYRSASEPGKREARVGAIGGPASHFLGARIKHVQGYDELFSSWAAILDRDTYTQFSFDARGGGQVDLGQFSIDELKPLTDVITALKGMVEPFFPGAAGDRPSLQVTLSNALELSLNIQPGYQNVRLSLPTFNETRIREAQDAAAFMQAATGDVGRMQSLMTWMKETCGGKVTGFAIGYGHDALSLDDDRFQALLDALTPYMQGATVNDTRRSINLRIESPDRPPQADPYGNLYIPVPFVEAKEIAGCVKAFFEKNSVS